MAIFSDFDGGYFTLTGLHANHPLCSYMAIDNAPQGCTRTRSITNAVGGRYLHRPDLRGTSAPRDALFRLATTDWVMCVDSHVILESFALDGLLDWIAANPNSNDLVTGPLLYDDGRSVSTHWRQEPKLGLWGTWDTDERYKPLGELPGAQGRKPRLRYGPPFEIPMQGLGLFAMRRQAWLDMGGFHPGFRGFGGEEGYIHEKTRRFGGRCLCLPELRWRHRFRHMEHGAPPPPYPLSLEDHTWNLLLGHRELGIAAEQEIYAHFGNRIPPQTWANLRDEAARVQPWGVMARRKRLKILGIWYTNNAAPEPLLVNSLKTIQRAAAETMHHDVRVTTSAWNPIRDNPFPCIVGKPDSEPGHAAIAAQMRKCIEQANGYEWDGILYLEHDVLYPPNYFDRMGNALATGAPVASNLDYEGLNATGWLAVKERHEPNHQLAMRRDVALSNLARAESECRAQGWALLEPQGDRNDWVRIPYTALCPSIHVNHEHCFTSHGAVCYEQDSRGRTAHPFWGPHTSYWPGKPEPSKMPAPQQQANGQQQLQQPPAPPVFATVEEWFEHVQRQPSDFHEHMTVLRDLAAGLDVVAELSTWLKPALLSMAAGHPKRLFSICPGPKPEWPQLQQILKGGGGEAGAGAGATGAGAVDVVTITGDSLEVEPFETDLLFIDTAHTAGRLYAELKRWEKSCRRYIVVHCTETYGPVGDDGELGVLTALDLLVRQSGGEGGSGGGEGGTGEGAWGYASHRKNNHGLTVLSRNANDWATEPITFRDFRRAENDKQLKMPTTGPGTHLKRLLSSLGINPNPSCACNTRAREMDMGGCAWCEANFDMIVQWMRDGQDQWGWRDKIKAAALAVTTGLVTKVNWADPFPGLLREAIRRAKEEEKEMAARSST